MADKDTAAGPPPAPVDDTPISPSRPNPGRKNSLEQHLMHRPERHELVESATSILRVLDPECKSLELL